MNAVGGWQDRCRTSVCWLDELWAADLPNCQHWLHALRQFDHVFVGLSGTAPPLSEAIGRPCYWLPGASTRFGSAHTRIHRPGRSTCTASDEDGKECMMLFYDEPQAGHLLCR